MILIALGANLPSQYGSPEDTLNAAMLALEKAGVNVLTRSSIWITEPVPASDQPLYRNAVIAVRTMLKPIALLNLLHEIEADFGRVRHERNEARILDLDLLCYSDVIIRTNDVYIPHPRMHERAFVMVPLKEVVPSTWVHPVLNKNPDKLLALLSDQSFKTSMKKCA